MNNNIHAGHNRLTVRRSANTTDPFFNMSSKQDTLPTRGEDGVFAAHQALARVMADQPSKPALQHKQRYPHPTHYLNEDGELSMVNRSSAEDRFPVPPHPWLFLDSNGTLQVIPGTPNAVALDPRYPLVRTSDLDAPPPPIQPGSDFTPEAMPLSNVARLAPEGSRYMCMECKKVLGNARDPLATGEFVCPRCRTLEIQGFQDLPPPENESPIPTSSHIGSSQRAPWMMTAARERQVPRELYVPTQKEITRRYQELLAMHNNGRKKLPTPVPAPNDDFGQRVLKPRGAEHAEGGPATVPMHATSGPGPSGPQLAPAFITPPRQTGSSSVNHPSNQSTPLGQMVRNLLPTQIHETSTPISQPDFGRRMGEPPVDHKGKGKQKEYPEPDIFRDAEDGLQPLIPERPLRRRGSFTSEDLRAVAFDSRLADLMESTKLVTEEPGGISGPSRASEVLGSDREENPRLLDTRRFPSFVDLQPTVEDVPEPEVHVMFVATKLKLQLQPCRTETMSEPVAPEAQILTTIHQLPIKDCKAYSFPVSKLKWYIPDNSAKTVLHDAEHTIEDTVYKMVSAEPITFGRLNSFFGIQAEELVYGTFAWVLKPKTILPGNWRFEEVKRAVESYWHCEYEVSIAGVAVAKLWPMYTVDGVNRGIEAFWEG
jgi:hypothetical protein